jgi:protein-S-isoprenylcysteine O-methyltransferase Ste14
METLQIQPNMVNQLSKLIGKINNYRADSSGWIGSVIMFIFALIAAYRWHTSGLIFFALLVVRDLAASWFLISRKPSKEKNDSRLSEVLAYVSSACPFIYLNSMHSLPQAGLVSSILAIIGFAISTLALFDLGGSFGVSPANRGVVRTGLYRYVRHPMYSGYAISELGFVFLNPVNLIIYCISIGFYLLRAKLESKILKT